MMTKRGGALVLVLTSPILRSSLVARLGLAGELFQTADTLDAVRLDEARRATAMLVIDQAGFPADCADIDAFLAARGWAGPIALLADADMPGLADRIAVIDPDLPLTELVERIRVWRTAGA